jgi:signal transduction histidine kinase
MNAEKVLNALTLMEAQAGSREHLYSQFLTLIKEASGAHAAFAYLLDPTRTSWQLAATTERKATAAVRVTSTAGKALSEPLHIARRPRRNVLDAVWSKCRGAVRSIPLNSNVQLAGVIQLGFKDSSDWTEEERDFWVTAASHCQMAAERIQLREELVGKELQIRKLGQHIFQAEESERRRISRELHDEAGQALVCIRLQMEMIEMALPDSASELRERLAETRDLTEKTILEIRRLIADLSPAVLEQFGLEAALRQLAKRLESVLFCHVTLVTENVHALPPKLQTVIYRIIQECCNNISKHSSAANVNILVSSADGVLSVQVKDDGIGFAVEKAFLKKDSFGLSGVRERVALLGGKFELVSRQMPKHYKDRARRPGTSIRVELPIPTEAGW